MAIRLTESRLRQIIREEAASLTRRPTRRLSEATSLASSSDVKASERGAHWYIDYDLDISTNELGGAGVGDDVTEIVAGLIPELASVLSDPRSMAVMINRRGPGGGNPVFRLYAGQLMIRKLAAALGELEGDAPGGNGRSDLMKSIPGY